MLGEDEDTSAVKLYLARDYSEAGFLEAWAQHVADYDVRFPGGLDARSVIHSNRHHKVGHGCGGKH